jgi:hypothetical protein
MSFGEMIYIRSADRRFGVGRRRILHSDTEKLTRVLAFPTDTLIQRIFHRYGTGNGAVRSTAAAKPALIRV